MGKKRYESKIAKAPPVDLGALQAELAAASREHKAAARGLERAQAQLDAASAKRTRAIEILQASARTVLTGQ